MSRRRQPVFLVAGGFTLVELLVVLAIIGILIGLTIPAVQQVRASARRAQCQSKLKNVGLAILDYESARKRLPLGATFRHRHSWNAQILPFIEQANVYAQIDFSQDWAEPGGNQVVALNTLTVFHCPTTLKDYPGWTDYCGISGTWQYTGASTHLGINGLLYEAISRRERGLSLASVHDGTSHTMIVAEGAGTMAENHGYWADGRNCFTHDNGPVNARHRPSDEIVGDHVGGANVVMCSASTHFLSNEMDAIVVASLCTRNGGEPSTEF